MSIVTRIFILIACTLLLVAGGELFNGLNLRQKRFAELRSDTAQLARIAELDMVRILDGTQQLLATLAKLPVERRWDKRACSIVEATASSDFAYDHINAVDLNGIVQCSSSGPSRIGTKMAEPKLLDRIVATPGFTVGSYGRALVSLNEVIRVGYPIFDESRTLIGAIYAAINVTWLNTAISQWQLGAKASIDITDRNGIVIARHPDPRGVGRPISDALKRFLSASTIGTTEVTAVGGVVHLYGYVPVNVGPSSGLAVFVGRDQAQLFADINRSIWLNVAVLLTGLLLSAILARVYVRRFLDRPFQNLLSVAGRWRDGDWSARSGTASGIPEFDRLAFAFDSMAAEVSARDKSLTQMARFDLLTGLANRGVFVEALQKAIAWAHRSGETFAVLFLDIDHFKDVNDTLGHPIGDLLLQEVAQRLRAIVRETDTVARFGGDEFAMVLVGIPEPADAAGVRTVSGERDAIQEAAAAAGGVAEKILKALSEPFSIRGNDIHSGTSVGIALYGLDSQDAETMLSQADMALYRAKSEARGIVRFFDDGMDAEIRARVTMGNELREAIALEQLCLVYQPQVDIDTGRIVGLEALVRWHHPTRGTMGPGSFIPAAERNGLIVPLARWVMREACRQTKQWLDAGIGPPLVSVNVSGVQFKRPLELEQDIAAIVSESGLPARWLELELTESVLMVASRQHNDLLLRFREAGYRITIDDFGSGYSSLDYLRRYPVDRIKIDQSFIADIGKTSGTDAIVRASLALARELGIEVVVEGVETAAQIELLKAWGCQIVQGFYFSRPLPAREVAELLRLGTIGPRQADQVEATLAA